MPTGKTLTAQYRRNRPLALERDDHQCQLQLEGCDVTATTADHVIPRISGGTDELDNLQAACKHCNSKKNKRPDQRAPHWRSRRWFG